MAKVIALFLLPAVVFGKNFSYLEFLKTTGVKDFPMPTYIYRCDDGFSNCHCEKACTMFGTCCVDYFWKEFSGNMSKYASDLLNKARTRKPTTCMNILPFYSADQIYMVSTCPAGSRKLLQEQCASQVFRGDMLPVIGINDYVYKNRFCALCNFVREFDVLNITAECNFKLNYTLPLSERYRGCSFTVTIDNDRLQYIQNCDRFVVDNCNNSNSRQCHLCKSYSAPVRYMFDCYKNLHCLKEAFFNLKSEEPLFSCSLLHFPLLSDGFFFNQPRYSVMVSLSSEENLKNDVQCAGSEVFDVDTTTCIDETFCGFGYEVIGAKCVKISHGDTSLNPANYSLAMAQKDIIRHCLKDRGYLITRRNSKTIIKETLNKTAFDAFENFPNDSSVVFSTSKLFISDMYKVDFTRTFGTSRICAQPRILNESIFTLSANCYLFINDAVLSPNNYILNSFHEKAQKRTLQLIVCKQFHLHKNCRLRKIDDYETLTGSIVVDKKSGIQYSAVEYTPLKEGIGVCINTPASEHEWVIIANKIEGHLTIIGCVFSIVGYIWTILTYILIPELNTVAGRNIVGLCATLMICDVLMLSTMSTNAQWCRISAYLLQYFSLASQAWCAVLAFDIWSKFRGKNIAPVNSKHKRFLTYSLMAMLVPALLTVTVITLESTKTLNFGYGSYGICWMTDFVGRIVTYVIPVLLVNCFTISSLSYTIYRIYRHSKKSGKLLKRKGGEDVHLVKMALKLIILLGTIEVLGFIQSQSRTEAALILNTIFKFIYTVARSFRGVFVCLFYVVTDRVLKIYRDIRQTGSLNPSRRSMRLSRQNTELVNVSTVT